MHNIHMSRYVYMYMSICIQPSRTRVKKAAYSVLIYAMHIQICVYMHIMHEQDQSQEGGVLGIDRRHEGRERREAPRYI